MRRLANRLGKRSSLKRSFLVVAADALRAIAKTGLLLSVAGLRRSDKSGKECRRFVKAAVPRRENSSTGSLGRSRPRE